MFSVEMISGNMRTPRTVRFLTRTLRLSTDFSSHRSVATCPKCDNGRAYFYQLQIRSADEPMTTCTCALVSVHHLWLTRFCSIVYRYVLRVACAIRKY